MNTSPFDAKKYITHQEALDCLREAYEHVDYLEGMVNRLADLTAKFQRGEPSDKFEKHGA